MVHTYIMVLLITINRFKEGNVSHIGIVEHDGRGAPAVLPPESD